MKKNIFILAAVLVAVMIFSSALVCAITPPDVVNKNHVMNKAYRMQIPFIENRGQVENSDVSFYAKTFGGTLFVGKDGTLTYSFPSEDKNGVVIKEIVTDNKVTAKGLEPSPTAINYFKGSDQSKWKTNIPSFNSVSLGEIYKGIELTLKAYGKNVEKLFTVLPSANPESIKVTLQGAKELKVNDKGELEVLTGHGLITFTKPLAYQEIEGKRVEVDVSYQLANVKCQNPNDKQTTPMPEITLLQHPTTPLLHELFPPLHHSSTPVLPNLSSTTPSLHGSSSLPPPTPAFVQSQGLTPILTSEFFPLLQYSTTPSLHESSTSPQQKSDFYGFKVAAYDKHHPLIIDPLLASTFIGGSGDDEAHSIALDGEGNVYITGSTASADYPATPGWKAVAAGDNSSGQCDVSSLTDVVQVAGGYYHTVGVKSDGTVVAVGNDAYYQCSNVSGWSDIVQVAAGVWHTVGLKSDGTVVAVGNNGNNQCNVGSWTGIKQITAGYYFTVGLKSDGTVVAVGDNGYGQCNVSTWTDIVQVAAGWNHTVGLESDGTVVAVGDNSVGQRNVSTWTDITQVAAGAHHTVGLQSNGEVSAVGYNSYNQCNVSGWTNVIQIAAGGIHTSGIKSDGTVVAVGDNGYGQCNVSTWTDITQVAAGSYHTIGIKSDGSSVVAAGDNSDGQCNVGSWIDIVQVISGGYYTVGLKSDGTVSAIGDNRWGQCNVGEWTQIIQVAAALGHTVGLKSDGTAVAVGSNAGGECNVAGWNNIIQVAAGITHTVGLRSDGTVVAVGQNDYGQCDVSGWTDIIQVAAGSYDTLGVKSDGSVVAVGSTVGDVSGWTNIVQVSSCPFSGDHIVGLKSDGTVVAVGFNNEGQCNVESWTDIVQVSADSYQTIGLKADGTVVTVGNCTFGQCYTGGWTDVIQVAAGIYYNVGIILAAYDQTHNGNKDVFVSKLDRDLTTLIASTFLGGNYDDGGRVLALDGIGNVYVTGYAQDGFPTTPGAYQEAYDGSGYDAFVSKLDGSLSTLLASTFIGGTNSETSYDLILDNDGNVYIAGQTASSNYPIIEEEGEYIAYDWTLDGYEDAFVSKLDSDLTTLLASTFLGGSYYDWGYNIADDTSGNIYVSGVSASSDYPTTPGAYDESHNGEADAFVSKLNNDLTTLLASTYVGGTSNDYCYNLALDGKGDVYIAGQLYSSDFPTTAGAYDTSYDGCDDVFVSKLNNALTKLLASTYLGGDGCDFGDHLVLDGCGNAYLTGGAEADFPTTPDAYNEDPNGNKDVFVSKLDTTLSFLFKSTFIGGNEHEHGKFLAIDASGNIFVTGYTWSESFPDTTGSGCYDGSYNGGIDVFVSKFDHSLKKVDPGFQSGSFLAETGPSFVFDADGDGVLTAGCNQLMLCDGQVAIVDVWLHDWNSATQGNISSIDYDFTWVPWDPNKLEVLSVDKNNPVWTDWSYTQNDDHFAMHVESVAEGGVAGTDFKLLTITFKVKDLTQPCDLDVKAVNGKVDGLSVPVITDGQIVVNAICGGDPITCETEDHCERTQDVCPDTGVTPVEDRYYIDPPETQFNEGDTITISHTVKGYYRVPESFDPTMCNSDCFNSCYENCAHAEVEECYLGCTRGCACEWCVDWDDDQVCKEYQNRINCSIKCYNTCFYSYDGYESAYYDRLCGYSINETVTLKEGDCETGTPRESFTLEGVGTASMNRSLPLADGPYTICKESAQVGDVLYVASTTGDKCRILMPSSSFEVTQGVNETLSNITLQADSSGTYNLELYRLVWNELQHKYEEKPIPQNQPSSLRLPEPASVAVNTPEGGIYKGTFSISAVNPQPVGGENFWANVIVRAKKSPEQFPACEATFDYSVDDGDGVYSGEDNCPNHYNPDQLDSYPPGGNGCGDACECHADCNSNQKVDLTDLVIMKQQFLWKCSQHPTCEADCNYDGNVNLSDLVIMKSEFNRNDCPVCP